MARVSLIVHMKKNVFQCKIISSRSSNATIVHLVSIFQNERKIFENVISIILCKLGALGWNSFYRRHYSHKLFNIKSDMQSVTYTGIRMSKG